MQESKPKFLSYQNFEGTINIEVLFEDETAWLTMPDIVTLFELSEETVLEHIIAGIEGDGFPKVLTGDDFKSVTVDKNDSGTDYFNLNVIRFVGDHYNSFTLTKFTIWVFKQMNEVKLKNLTNSPKDIKWKKDHDWAENLKARLKAKGIDLDAKMLRVNSLDDIKELIIPIIMEITDKANREEKEDELRKPPLGPSLN